MTGVELSSFFFLWIFVENSTVVSTKVSWERKRPKEVKNELATVAQVTWRGTGQEVHQSANSQLVNLFGRKDKTIAFSSGH
jgi:hypothetical protein